jgi:hypothetical protein
MGWVCSWNGKKAEEIRFFDEENQVERYLLERHRNR